MLENQRAKLILLDLSNYQYLLPIAAEKNIIQYSPSDISTPEKLKTYVQTAVDGYYHKTTLPFLIYDKQAQAYAGCTRFGRIDHHNKTLEIGWTWLGKDFRGSGLNKYVKHLMLTHAFKAMKIERVAFHIDERNIVSRKAVEKIGAKLEGILRNHTLMLNGFRRNTCVYSIIRNEWEIIKKQCFDEFNE
jgi:RimJ/RimL family protein N-acetyltransferase